MNQERELTKNTVIIAISKLAVIGINFFLLPFMTRYMLASEYGVLDLIVSYSGLVLQLLVLNMDRGALRFLIDARTDSKATVRIITSILMMSLPLLAVAVLISFIISVAFETSLYAVIGLYFVFLGAANIFQQFSRGIGNNKIYAVSLFVQMVVAAFGIIISLSVFESGIIGVLISYIIGYFASFLTIILFVKFPVLLSIKNFDKSLLKDILYYSLPMIPSSICWWIFGAMDRTIITLVIGTFANGIYAISNKFSNLCSILIFVFDQSWTESASVNIDSSNKDVFFSRVFEKNISIFGSISLLAIGFIPLVFNFLVSDDNYREGYLYIPVLVFGCFISAMVNFCTGVFLAKKMMRKIMITSALAAIVNLIIDLTLIWFIGIWAAAISTTVAYLILFMYRYNETKKYVKISVNKKMLALILGALIICSGIYYFSFAVESETLIVFPLFIRCINIIIVSIVSYLINRTLIHRSVIAITKMLKLQKERL